MALDRDGPKLATGLLIAALAALAGYNAVLAKRALAGRPCGRVMEIGNLHLHFIDAGTGMPLLLLHGNGSIAEDFKSSGIFELAANSNRVLAFDRPGFGRSSRSPGRSWSACEQADVIHDAVRKLGIEQSLVLGHSLGAWVAIVARRHTPSVAGMLLVSGYYYPPPQLALALAALPALPVIGTAFRHTLLPLLVRLAWPWAMKKIFSPAEVDSGFAALAKEFASRPSQLQARSGRRPYGSPEFPAGGGRDGGQDCRAARLASRVPVGWELGHVSARSTHVRGRTSQGDGEHRFYESDIQTHE